MKKKTLPTKVEAPERIEPQVEAVAAVASQDQSAAKPDAGLEAMMRAERDNLHKQFNNLSSAVLDAAEVANRSADMANRVGADFERQMAQLSAVALTTRKINMILMGTTAGVMLITLIVFAVLSARMSSRISQLDEMLLAVGKRAVELNAGMVALDSVNAYMKDLTAKQGSMVDVQAQVEAKINDALKKSESLMQNMPNKAAQQITSASTALTREVQSINGKLQQQAKAVQTLGEEVKELKSGMSNVSALKRDVQALVVIQKDRVLEQLQKQQPAARPAPQREPALQYPRPKPESQE
jgi:archaellum component FlaC